MKNVLRPSENFNTCWSVGEPVVKGTVRKRWPWCAARVTWYSFHSNASDAALLAFNAVGWRCPNVPNGHTHNAKFATMQTSSDVRKRNKTGRRAWRSADESDEGESRSFIALIAIPIFKGWRVYRPKAPSSGHDGFGSAITRRRPSQIAGTLACCVSNVQRMRY